VETITSRTFQVSYQRLVEPVVVKANFRTLGTWYPDGTQPDEDLGDDLRQVLAQRDAANEEVRQLKRQLAERGVAEVHKPTSNVRAAAKPAAPTAVHLGTASFNSQPFTPVPKGK
jgi:hypothetical protein